METHTLSSTTNRPSYADTLIRGYRMAAAIALAAFLIAGLALPAQAQPEAERSSRTAIDTKETSERIHTPRWQHHFDAQAARVLRQSPMGTMRTTVLRNVIVIAQQTDDLDLSETTDALLHVIEHDPDRQRRLMAVQALHVVGSQHADEDLRRQAMKRLYALMQNEPSDHVRQAASAHLQAYFGTVETHT